ncbi:MAG: hypothetical protein OXC40_02035 [Proteobacteria bacterium]|nr:hypothetical protein [Pseudomonadota bacterium]
MSQNHPWVMMSSSTYHDHTLFIEQADVIDLGLWLDGKPVGASFALDCELSGPLSPLGFVSDFSVAKKTIKNTLKKYLDHRFVVPLADEFYELQENKNQVVWQPRSLGDQGRNSYDKNHDYVYVGPRSSVYPIRGAQVSESVLSQEITELVGGSFREIGVSYSRMQVTLSSMSSSPVNQDVCFRYTHGISGHQGQCHRLWHGHSSKVIVWRNGERSPALEAYLKEHIIQKQSIHLAEPGQIVAPSLWDVGSLGPKAQLCEIKYQSASGYYYAKMPASSVFLLPSSTSVEVFAQSLASAVKKEDHLAHIRVQLYEGLGKGSIYCL